MINFILWKKDESGRRKKPNGAAKYKKIVQKGEYRYEPYRFRFGDPETLKKCKNFGKLIWVKRSRNLLKVF